ncbi:hypothetical protein [Chitinophaga niabensis]|uniref:Lipocalin-like domain-containing protein n=1 Tax=Chitinophaga niabensis TaxID=536979 RepID=A0A1N6J931_9BACT|nr:hypothetical protein [Chitinophaga niabensis]SIO40681.1 hypothetical protein SAMN04488055_3750 [Chitinophaga niabensis]
MKHIVLFATFLILAGTACKKSKKDVTSDFLRGKWEDGLMSLAPQAAYTFSSGSSYTWFPGGTATTETGTYQLKTTTTQNVFELRLTKTGTTTPDVGTLEKISNTLIKVTVNNKTRTLMRLQ